MSQWKQQNCQWSHGKMEGYAIWEHQLWALWSLSSNAISKATDSHLRHTRLSREKHICINSSGSTSVLLPRAFISVTRFPLMCCSLLLSNHNFCLVLTPSQENGTLGKRRDCFADRVILKLIWTLPAFFFFLLVLFKKSYQNFSKLE